MVDHKVDDQVKVMADFFHIVPGAEGGIHLIISFRGKPTVGGRGVEGQNVNPPDGLEKEFS